jgi:hypothetical protein
VASTSRAEPPASGENPRITDRHEELGDFTTTSGTLSISALAMGIGALCAFVALALLRLIGLFTNLFYFGRWSSTMVSPVGNHLGVYSVLVPIAGALIIGVMATRRFLGLISLTDLLKARAAPRRGAPPRTSAEFEIFHA